MQPSELYDILPASLFHKSKSLKPFSYSSLLPFVERLPPHFPLKRLEFQHFTTLRHTFPREIITRRFGFPIQSNKSYTSDFPVLSDAKSRLQKAVLAARYLRGRVLYGYLNRGHLENKDIVFNKLVDSIQFM